MTRKSDIAESWARTFVISPRGFTNQLSRCGHYEFEDTICDLEDAHLVAPVHNGTSRLACKLRNRISNYSPWYGCIPTGTRAVLPQASYELGFFLVQFARDLINFDAVRDWRRRAQIAVCVIEELWTADIPRYRHKLNILKDFDLIFCCCAASVDALAEHLDRPVHYLPPAVDAIRFAPHPGGRPRVIDVFSMGRRSSVTHEALVDLARRDGLYYYHDTLARPFFVRDPAQHRLVLANTIKHSRYFIANLAKIDRLHETKRQPEVGQRFFEGMAGGAVLIGDPPRTAVFRELFDWPDAVIAIPFDCPHIGEIIEGLDAQPDRLDRIRRQNVAGIAGRHDWLHRWQAILKHADLPETERMADRMAALHQIAQRMQPPEKGSGCSQSGRIVAQRSPGPAPPLHHTRLSKIAADQIT